MYVGDSSQFLNQVCLFIRVAAESLEFYALANDFGQLLHKHVLSYFSTKDRLVGDVNAELIQLDRVSEVDIDVARDAHQHDEEGRDEHYDVILLAQQYLRQCNANVVGARAIRVAVLLVILSGSIIS